MTDEEDKPEPDKEDPDEKLNRLINQMQAEIKMLKAINIRLDEEIKDSLRKNPPTVSKPTNQKL